MIILNQNSKLCREGKNELEKMVGGIGLEPMTPCV